MSGAGKAESRETGIVVGAQARHVVMGQPVAIRPARSWVPSRGGSAALSPVRTGHATSLGPVRLGVLDVGSNTVRLLVVDAHPGANPQPAASEGTPLRLASLLDGNGALTASGADQLVEVVADARRTAERLEVEEMMSFATSALRDATNGDEVIRRVREQTGVQLQVLPGEEEARLTFLAVRRWFGWSAGRLLALDVGGGSLEIACGEDEDPEVAESLPLGASRLTLDWLPNDPPKRNQLAALRKYVRAQLAGVVPHIYRMGEPHRVVATSKTFRSLARIAGVAPYNRGPYVRRVVSRAQLDGVASTVARLSVAERATLPGVSQGRAQQLAAGAVVAAAALDLFEIEEVEICPWALREGVILRHLDHLRSES